MTQIIKQMRKLGAISKFINGQYVKQKCQVLNIPPSQPLLTPMSVIMGPTFHGPVVAGSICDQTNDVGRIHFQKMTSSVMLWAFILLFISMLKICSVFPAGHNTMHTFWWLQCILNKWLVLKWNMWHFLSSFQRKLVITLELNIPQTKHLRTSVTSL